VTGTSVWAAQDVAYYALSPGTLYPGTDLVIADSIELDDPSGEVMFTTVTVDHLTRFERWFAERDSDIDILSEEVILGDRSDDENREFNARLMEDSKQTAIALALTTLGEEVDLTGTGAGVSDVSEDLPVAEVLRPGDTVVFADGQDIALADDLVAVIQAREPGDVIELVVENTAGDERTVDAELVEREGEPGSPMLGVVIETRDPGVNLPFAISIDTGDVGGPSAGLAMTLAVLDVLTEGELTGGGVVATTGTIRSDGSVGAVGGVKQKTIAAREAGVALFIVPLGEVEEAQANAGEMRIAGVETLDDALAVLEEIGGDPLPATLDVAA